MKQLFERYEAQSQEVEKILEESIEMVRERKSPNEDLCERIGSALRGLRSVYDEIADKLPDQIADTVPKDVSVRDLEELWENSVARKQMELKAVLSEFVRVYSDDERYQDAITTQLAEAESLLAIIEADEKASPEVGPYALFLQGIKTDLNANEELFLRIEDELDKVFPYRAISGLTKKKYHIRSEESVSPEDSDLQALEESGPVAEIAQLDDITAEDIIQVQGESVSVDVDEVPVDNVVEDATDEATGETLKDEAEESLKDVSEESVKDVSEELINNASEDAAEEPKEIEYIHPEKPITITKIPSEQKFEEIISNAGGLFLYLVDNLTFDGLMGREDVVKFFADEPEILSPDRISELLEYLERKGLIAVYKDQEREILCFTALMMNCLKKKSLESIIKRKFKRKYVPKVRLFALQDYPLEDFRVQLDLSDLYREFYLKKIEYAPYLDYLPATKWDDDNRSILAEFDPKDGKKRFLLLVAEEDYLTAEVKPDEGLMCYAEELPEVRAVVDGAVYACMTPQGLFVLKDGTWNVIVERIDEGKDASPEKAENTDLKADDLTDQDQQEDVREKDQDENSDDSETAEIEDTAVEEYVESIESAETPETVKEKEKKTGKRDSSKSDRNAEADRTQDSESIFDVEKFVVKAKGAFAIGRFDIGNVLLQAVSKVNGEYAELAKQYSFATWDPMNREDYRPSNVMNHFPEQSGKDPENDLLFMASWLRMYFSEAASYESYLAREKKQIEGNLSNEYAPSLTQVVNALADWTRNQGRGLDQSLLESALKHSSITDRLAAIKKKAREMIDSKELLRSNHYTNRIRGTREALFGKDSTLFRQLQAVIEDGKNQSQKIRGEIAPYVSLDNGVLNVNDDAIEDLLDETWRGTAFLAKGKGQSNDLTGVERNTLRNKLNSIYRLLGTWILLTGTNKTISADNNEVVKLVGRVKPLLVASVKELEEKKTESRSVVGPIMVLKSTLIEVLQRIDCSFDEELRSKYYYAELMKEPLVALDEDYLPYIEEPEDQMNPYDFCKRAALYLEAPEKSWEDAIKRIFILDDTRDGENYGTARLLKDYLNEVQPDVHWPPEYDIDRAVERALDKNSKRGDSVLLWEQDFSARLEMAEGDGWFASTSDREKIEHVRAANYDAYYLSENFGFYGRALKYILEETRKKAAEKRPVYIQRLENMKNALSEQDQSAPVFDRIAELIQADRFGAAESYLQQAAQGILEIRNEGLGDPNSEFNKFIQNCSFYCMNAAPGKKLEDSFRAQNKNVKTDNNVSTGEMLLHSWPENPVGPDVIDKILVNLGLEAKVVGDRTKNHFHASFEDKGRIENYPHPIADFGTKMYKQGLDIVLIFGSKSTDELFTAMNAVLQRTTNKPVLILMNCTISLPERRKLARKIAANIRTNAPCLLLDRALVYYVANCALSERWKILIQCALPFQPTQIQNPYFENSSAEIPPEMFIGRREELQTIIDPAGANLIYGGRQLGKTALLQRAKTLQYLPKEKSWSAYVDVKGMDVAEAAKAIGKALVQCHFLMQDTKVKNWKELVESIELRLMARTLTGDKLLLLIDEADHLLVKLEASGYKELDLLKRLQGTTEGRFKFVMAGLHNVVRFSQKALAHNSSLPQLQGITVKPLSFSDARELLEIPLSYLGFMIKPGEEDIIASILFNTNYFPGLIHFYASRLVKYMQKNASQGTMPPYTLDRDVLTRLLADEEFRRMRVERLKMTLGIDADEHSYYDALAHLLCYCSITSEDVRNNGMTAAEIREECKGFSDACSISMLEVQSIEALLDELVELNIFRCEIMNGQKRYLFSRPMFIEMLGSKEVVESHLLEVLEK